MRRECPKCGRLLVEPSGPPKAKILLAGEFPGFEEIRKGTPWIGKAGEILRSELQLAGINPASCRITNLWLHAKVGEEECPIDFHYTQLLKEMQGREAILLMGSDLFNLFVPGESVRERSGLDISSEDIPKTVRVAIAMVNPAIVLHDKIGEVRWAIRRFSRRVKENE